MAYPTITINELKTHLKKIKKNKATGPDNIKGELYTALQKSDICTRKLHNILQNILDNETKVKTWEKSLSVTLTLELHSPTILFKSISGYMYVCNVEECSEL